MDNENKIYYKLDEKNDLSNNIIENKKVNNEINLDMNLFLADKQRNAKEAWAKLDKTIKIKKLIEYVEDIYSKEHNLTQQEIEKCNKFLIDMLEKKKFTKTKDINYNKNDGKILSIPNLIYNKTNGIFNIINDRRVSTLKSLPNMKKIKNKKKSKTCDERIINLNNKK